MGIILLAISVLLFNRKFHVKANLRFGFVMNKEDISYVCIIICALVALACSIYAFGIFSGKTNLKIISDSNLHNGDSFHFAVK